MPEFVVDARDLRRSYGRKGEASYRLVLDGIDLQLQAGELVVLMGPSGSGKSTLLGILGALDSSYEGSLSLFGTATQGMSDQAISKLRGQHIGFVFQAFGLIEHLSVLDNVLVPSLFVPRHNARASGREALERVGLLDRAQDPARALSGGQRQRVAIARAIAHHPELLLCDEPTGNLDRETANQVVEVFQALHRSGTTILCATHESTVNDIATRTLQLRNGRLDPTTAPSAS